MGSTERGESKKRDMKFSLNALFKGITQIIIIIINFNVYFLPGKCLSLDETMVLWRGRLSFRQYIGQQINITSTALNSMSFAPQMATFSTS